MFRLTNQWLGGSDGELGMNPPRVPYLSQFRYSRYIEVCCKIFHVTHKLPKLAEVCSLLGRLGPRSCRSLKAIAGLNIGVGLAVWFELLRQLRYYLDIIRQISFHHTALLDPWWSMSNGSSRRKFMPQLFKGYIDQTPATARRIGLPSKYQHVFRKKSEGCTIFLCMTTEYVMLHRMSCHQ